MKHASAREILERVWERMLDADRDNSDWAARQFIAVHMRQFPTKQKVSTETNEEVQEDGFELTAE